jgi:ribonuclease D
MIYKETISKEELDELPFFSFEGEIVIVDSKDKLREAVRYMSQFPFLGFDTETRPSFKKGHINQVALLQLSTHERAFLFRLNRQDLSRKIFSILSNPSILKAGVAIRDDVKVLQTKKRFTPAGFIELQDEAKSRGIECFSLKKLAGIVLGLRISKAQQLSNWEADELTEPQLRYAATDAWLSYKIYEHFENNNHE